MTPLFCRSSASIHHRNSPVFRLRKPGKLIALCLGGLIYGSQSQAMDFHIHGQTIVGVGGVIMSDGVRFNNLLRLADTAGKRIDKFVLRNSPGGVITPVPEMMEIIRSRGMTTIADGGCYSACSLLFAAGVTRQFAQFDLPVRFDKDSRLTYGIHGGSLMGKPLPTEKQETHYNRMLTYLGDISPEAKARILLAYTGLETASGSLNYYALQDEKNPPTFCPGNSRTAANCQRYPHVSALTDGIITTSEYGIPSDRLTIAGRTVYGNINPNFGKVTLGNTFGIISVGDKGHWDVSTRTGANIIRVHKHGRLTVNAGGRILSNNLIAASDNGHIHLNGGTLSGTVFLRQGGILSGTGMIDDHIIIHNSTFSPEGIVVTPHSQKLLHGSFFSKVRKQDIVLSNDGRFIANVDHLRKTPLLTVMTGEGYDNFTQTNGRYRLPKSRYTAALKPAPGAVFELNAVKNFYKTGQNIPIVDHQIDTRMPIAPKGAYCNYDQSIVCPDLTVATIDHSSKPIAAKFRLAASSDNPNDLIVLSDNDDLIPVRKNSLLKMKLVQTDDFINLVAQPTFDDRSLFKGRIGDVLRIAASRESSPIATLLGHLQFATAESVAKRLPTLRGDAKAAAQNAGRNMGQHIGSLISQHQDSARRNPLARSPHNQESFGMDRVVDTGDNSTLARIGGAFYKVASRNGSQTPTTKRVSRAAPAEADLTAAAFDRHLALTGSASNPLSVWGRAGASEDHLSNGASSDSSRLKTTAFAMGIDHLSEQQERVIGTTIGFGNATARDNNGGSQRVNAYDLGIYLDQGYQYGYVTATARYTHYKTSGTRVIQDIEGLEEPYRSKYSNNGLSLNLEHAWRLPVINNIAIRPLLPILDYQHIAGVTYDEAGNGPAALRTNTASLNSLKLGVGVYISSQNPLGYASETMLLPYVKLRLYRQMLNTQSGITNAFLAEPDLRFGTVSDGGGRFGAAWNAGVSLLRGNRTALTIDYAGNYARNYLENGLSATLRYSF